MPAGRPGSAMTAASCCWPTRTGPSGTTPPSGRVPPSCATRCAGGGRGGLLSWPPSPPCTPERLHGTPPTGAEIVGLYDLLVQIWPSPVVALNRAVAVGLADGPEAGLDALDALADEPLLATYSYFAAARADFLRRLGRTGEARAAYEEALLLSENAVERTFLAERLAQVES